ncbi:AI-2E family transporter [Wenzhouxiangella marina]|uniref:Putative membrane protein n=1 Tax=Wenzhouxiangella marina TaxID=1579979 RepID=A0A0K0XWH7_9GAMM|nr:AI-2E family transporter [Wenzhouxiangella marina]AKS41987.1 Putative membrane protein [Wenzhouxiangella marina]MBB6086246.1 putative PurR-regulated permease PerM [Wenzhouxiangella marina]
MVDKLEQRSFLILLAVVTALFLFLLKPFFAPILWACIIAVLFHPLQIRLERWWGPRPNLTALTTLLACVVLVVIPVLLLLTSFVQQGVDLYQRLDSGELRPGQYLDQVRAAFPMIQELLERFDINTDRLRESAAAAAMTASRLIAQNAFAVGQSTFEFVLKLALMLYVAFFLLRDGRRLIEELVHALPLGDERERLLFRKFSEVTRATVKGNLLVAMAQGALGGIIFWILGLPAALLWGVVMAVLSLIPAVGAGLVWLPAAIYLYAIGEWVSATVLIAYGLIVIGLADNILRPILVGRDTKLPDWMVLLSTLGGLALFGINGFVVGPLIAVVFIAFWQIFSKEFNQKESNSKKTDEVEESNSSEPEPPAPEPESHS